jgi:glycosyltransferase involved in cell wall biosynthesis
MYLFTIIIATHDRPLLLKRTLESLIAQTCQNFKLVIVADSSAYIPPYQELQAFTGRFVYIIRSGVNGPAESRNMGLAVTSSDYVVFLDDDDTFKPDHLQNLVDSLTPARPALLFCDFQVQDEDRTVYPPTPLSSATVSIADVTVDTTYVRNRIPNSCLAYRGDVLADIRYDTDLVLLEDWEFLLACLKGRGLVHAAFDSVVIHKSAATAPENLRRGNTRNEELLRTMLQIYKKHPGPSMEIRQARQGLLAQAGVALDIDHF